MSKVLKARLADLVALLLSFLLALVIWVNANQVEDPLIRRALQIPVEYLAAPEDVRIIEPSNLNTPVLIAFEGPTSIVNELTAEDFLATVDLSQVPKGQELPVPVVVQTENTEIALDPPAPSEINVHLEELVTKEVPVQLEFRGSVPRGYTAETPLIEPNVIKVRGLASDVNRLAFARVNVFLNNSDTQTKIETPQPIFYDSQGNVASVIGLDLDPNRVTVTVPINEAEDFANKVISVNVVGNPAPGYRVLNATVNPPSVLVTGTPTQLERPFTVQTEPIDVTGLTETFETRVSLDLPPGITLDEVQEISATVEIEPFSSTKVFNRPVELQGTNEELETIIEPENIRVVLFGPLPVLDALPEQEVLVTLDIFGLDVGTHELEPAVTIPDRGLELRSIQPALVTVNITRPVTISDTITDTNALTDTSSFLLRDRLTVDLDKVGRPYQPSFVPLPALDDPRRFFTTI